METDISYWLLDNRIYILEILNPIIKEYNSLLTREDNVFFKDINIQFQRKINEVVAIELGKQFALSPCDVIQSLEDIDWDIYLNWRII